MHNNIYRAYFAPLAQGEVSRAFGFNAFVEVE